MKLKIVVIGLIIFTSVALGFEGGDGSSVNPYQISTCQQLQEMSPNHGSEGGLSDHYELVGDVDCSDTVNWNSGEGFNPVSDEANRFGGSLNGADYSVNEIYVNSGNFSGLIGFLDQGSSFGNISLIDVDITGTEFVGGAIGYNDGGTKSVKVLGNVNGIDKVGGITGYNAGPLISDSISLEGEFYGSVSGNRYVGGIVGESYGKSVENSIVVANIDGNSDVGGIAGYAYGSDIYRSAAYSIISANNRAGGVVGRKDSDIIQTYSSGSVSADDYVGGLVGSSQQDVIDSYATSRIEGDTNVGGALGSHSSGTITDAYWDINSTNQIDSDGGIGLTTSEMIGSSAESSMNMDFSNTWATQSFYYPRLQWMDPGSGTESDPYRIFSCKELQALQNNLTAHYELANDIDCFDTVNWNGGDGFDPIGPEYLSEFIGELNGNNHTVIELFVDNNDTYTGLFGYNKGIIQDIRTQDVNITGNKYVGGLVGRSHYGDVFRSFSSGYVSGGSNVGGLVGYNRYNELNDIFSNVTVDGDYRVGGLVGRNRGEMNNTFSSGSVAGGDEVGGLIGFNDYGDVFRSFSSGYVSGGSNVGGLVGSSQYSSVTYSYWDDESSNQGFSRGGTGLTTSEMQGCNAESNLQGLDFDNTWIAQQNDYPALRFFTSEGLSCDAFPPSNPSILLPMDGANDVPIDTNLTVVAEGTGLVNITFYDNTSSSTEIRTIDNVNASASEQASIDWSFRETDKLYKWYAVAENSQGTATSQEWNFTTESSPEVLGYSPSDGATTAVNPDLNVTVSDDISNDIDISYYDSSDNLIGEVTGLNTGAEGSLDISADSFGNSPGQTYEWYAVVETDSTTLINISNSLSFPDYWNFTTQNTVDISITSNFVDGINLNNGSADIGASVLEFNLGNDQGVTMSSATIDIDGVQEASFTNIQNDSNVQINISSLGIDQDRSAVPWSIEATEGLSTEVLSGTFSTHTVELSGEPSDSSHDSVKFYYSETNSTDKNDYRALTSVGSSDTSPIIVSSANRELGSGVSDEHCFTASASRSGLESIISNPVCVGGDIP